jgi:hypothetical protein
MPQPLLLATTRDEPKKLHQSGALSSGPVFDFGPGWGFYVKRWFGKYLFKIVLPAIVLIAATSIYVSSNEAENNEQRTAGEKITVAVVRGDSRALLARKALAEYLKENPQETLTGGQKLFIEETLRRKLNNPKLTVGEIIEFAEDDIRSAISQAKQLAPFQLEVWERYARGIKF